MFVRRRFLFVPLLLASFPGCGPSPAAAPKTPHAGMLFPIPEGKGTVEILKKPAEGRADQVQLVVYFYGPDDKPMTPLPTTVTLLPSTPKTSAISLKDAGAESSMISEPFSSDQEAEGKLQVTIDGKRLAIAIRDR